MSRDTVACVTTQPASASASISSNCVPTRFRARSGPGWGIIQGRGSADEEMTAADERVERAADKLQAIADSMAAEGGVKSKLAQPLADDAEFLRKLKPSLIKARAKGELPTDQKPAQGHTAPSGPQLGNRP